MFLATVQIVPPAYDSEIQRKILLQTSLRDRFVPLSFYAPYPFRPFYPLKSWKTQKTFALIDIRKKLIISRAVFMKSILNLIFLTCVILLQFTVNAQTFTVLNFFTNPVEGWILSPECGIVLSGTTLYGTTSAGGPYGGYQNNNRDGFGTVFAIQTDGTGFTNLYAFSAANPLNGKNADGFWPLQLISDGETLFGSTSGGGSDGYGTVFSINTNGNDFTTLDNLTQDAGFQAFVLVGNTLYGSGPEDGYGAGSIGKINTDGTGYSPLYSFTEGNDGFYLTGLISSSNVLYGTAWGSEPDGSVFMLDTNGTGFTVLHTFTNGDDGAFPYGVVLSGQTLYGAAALGGVNGSGTIYKVNTDGSDFTVLYSFSEPFYDSNLNIYTNGDGIFPTYLILSGNKLYGATCYPQGDGGIGGGLYGNGTIFEINTDGTGFTTLYNFTSQTGGSYRTQLILSSNVLYGETGDTVYSLSLPPPMSIALNIRAANDALILTWTNSAFALQSASNINGTFTNVYGATSPYTNIISGTQQFFRLDSK
jgi:uncharacterized repeat protein (TIGR03803 family)